MLPSHEPRGEDPDDRHEKREGSNGRRRVARHQPVPAAVAEKGRDDDDISEGGEAGRTDRRHRALPAARQRTSGSGTKKIAGKAVSPKRRALTTKFTAQQTATTAASTWCTRGTSLR